MLDLTKLAGTPIGYGITSREGRLQLSRNAAVRARIARLLGLGREYDESDDTSPEEHNADPDKPAKALAASSADARGGADTGGGDTFDARLFSEVARIAYPFVVGGQGELGSRISSTLKCFTLLSECLRIVLRALDGKPFRLGNAASRPMLPV